jgi:excisionase family DNA binding protein
MVNNQLPNVNTARMTTREAADWLGVHRETLLRLCRRGRIAYYSLPSGYQFDPADLQAYLDQAHRPAHTERQADTLPSAV